MAKDSINNNKMNKSNISYNSNKNKNSNNENSFNKNISISYFSKHDEERIIKKECKAKRYGLMKHEKRLIRCRGLLLHNSRPKNTKNGKMYTVLNIVDSYTGSYLSDHIQLNAEEIDKTYVKDLNGIYLIEFAGRVYNYDNQRPDAYGVDITHEKGFVEILNNEFHVIDDIKYTNEDSQKMLDFIFNLNLNELLMIIDYLRKLINKSTRIDLGENFIYNYAVNQLMFNMNNKDLYSLKLPMEHLTRPHLADLIVVLSNILLYLTTNPNNICFLFTNITQYISGIQCVIDYYRSNEYFKHYVSSFTNSKLSPESAWHIVQHRAKNFNLLTEQAPNKNDLLNNASCIFNAYVTEFNKIINKDD